VAGVAPAPAFVLDMGLAAMFFSIAFFWRIAEMVRNSILKTLEAACVVFIALPLILCYMAVCAVLVVISMARGKAL
jgi:hypothetical protein